MSVILKLLELLNEKAEEHLMRPSWGEGSLFPLNIYLCFLVPQITFKLAPSFFIPKI